MEFDCKGIYRLVLDESALLTAAERLCFAQHSFYQATPKTVSSFLRKHSQPFQMAGFAVYLFQRHTTTGPPFRSQDEIADALFQSTGNPRLLFSIPIMLRIYFKYDRKLLTQLCHCANEILQMFFRTVLGLADGLLRMIMVIHICTVKSVRLSANTAVYYGPCRRPYTFLGLKSSFLVRRAK